MKTARIIASSFMAVAMLVLSAGTVSAGYFPTDPSVRPTYSCNADGTACPGADHVQFDSFVNNPVVGDERPFLAGSVNGQGNVQDRVQVKDGDTIVVRAYVHNNADATKMGGETNTLARNVNFNAIVPTASGTDMNIVGFLSADNASPKSINDTMSVYGARPFTLEYVKGSAQFINKPDGKNLVTTKLSDSIVMQQGALLGNILGCFEYSGYVTFTVKVHMPTPKTPVLSCDLLKVEKSGDRKVEVTKFSHSQSNATFQNVTIDWGDGSSALTTDQAVGKTHSYAKNGSYTISAVAHFSTNSGSETATSQNCNQTVNFVATPPSKPTVLPETGAGNIFAIFALSSLAGAIAHWFWKRKVARV